MVTKYDYNLEEVEVCYSALIELMTVLGEYRADAVLIGGWVPYFLCPEHQKEHTGSLDIDIALDFSKIGDDEYQTILEAIKKRDWNPGRQPFIYEKIFRLSDESDIPVEINFMAGEYGGKGKSHRHQDIQDIKARKARGCDLVFDNPEGIIVRGRMPDGSSNEVSIQVSSIVPFLVTKGMAIWDRYKEKDAYDIHFCLQYYPANHDTIVGEFEEHLGNKLVREGLEKIRAKFVSIDAPGPVWAANFEVPEEDRKDNPDAQEKWGITQRSAFERVDRLMSALGIEPFKGT